MEEARSNYTYTNNNKSELNEDMERFLRTRYYSGENV